jgi:serine/threonine-protein kinase
MHRILTGDPPPIDGVDPSLARVVEHCLEKKPGERFQSARDLAFQLEAILRASDFKTPAGTGLAGSDSAFRSQLRRWLPWAVTAAAVVAAVAALAGGWRLSGSGRPAAALRRFSLPMAEMPLLAEWPPLAISPDGRRVAYVAGGGAPIKVHDLETLATTAVEGTANGFAPFFSPDGQHLGFFTSDALMHVALAGGPPVRVAAAAPVSRGAVWTDDGRIYFSATPSDGIFRVDAGGGRVEPVTELDQSAGEFGHIWPDVAPEGRFLVYVARRGDSFDESRIVARSLRTGLRRTIVEGGTHPRVAEDGRIVFARGETLYAVDIDPDDLTPRKPPEPILRGVQMDPLFGGACYAIARDGTLVYAPGDARPPARSLIWVTAAGAEASAFPEERPFLYPAISADGSAVAITIEGMNQDVWRFDIGRPVLARLTSSHGEDFGAVWSPDGQRLAYTSVRPGHEPAVFVKSADGVDGETLVAGSSFPNAWTTAGDGLIVTVNAELGARSVTGLARVPLTGGKPVGLEPSRFGRYAALLSPDGGHLAFVSLETGRPEVFVARPDSSNARQASVGGGTSPVWARDGRQLFYSSGDAVMAVVVGSGDRPALSAPRLLFRGRYEEPARPDWPRNYDVAPDGRFLMIRPTYSPTVRELIVVLGWRGQRL